MGGSINGEAPIDGWFIYIYICLFSGKSQSKNIEVDDFHDDLGVSGCQKSPMNGRFIARKHQLYIL